MAENRVLIVYNEPTLDASHRDADSEHEILYTSGEVEKILVAAGYEVAKLGVHIDPSKLVRGIKKHKPDVIFNLFEGLPGRGQTEAYAVGLYDWLGIPYTGCPFRPLALARDKPLTKTLLKGAGLPTPDYFTVEELPLPPCPLDWPVIVKPSNQDASVGIDQGSVVDNQTALAERVAYLLEEYGPPILVEEFVRGREFNAALIENPDLQVLPLAEILFEDPNGWPILTYDAKWKPESPDYIATPPHTPTDLSPRALRRIGDLAKRAYQLLGCRDYARVDFRVKEEPFKPYILEVNPNPDFSPMAGLSAKLDAANIGYAAFTLQLVRAALERGATPMAEPEVFEVVPW